MITLTAKIKLLNSESGTINSAATSVAKNNVSAELSDVVNIRQIGSKPWIIGATAIGEHCTLESNVRYFIGSVCANASNQFETPYVITISGSRIKSLNMVFDDVNHQYPTSIEVDGITYANNSELFSVLNLISTDTHIVTISNWNVANYPLRLHGISIDVAIEINNKNIISIDRIINERRDIEKPSWGIISNTGEIKFNDFNEQIKNYIQRQYLTKMQIVIITIANTSVSNKSEQVGEYNTEKWNYDNVNRTVTVSLKDDLEEWQNILTNGMSLQPQVTMLQMYNYLKNITPLKWTFAPLSADVINILTNTICGYPYLESGSLWAQWNKLCEVCALYVYKNNENNIVVSNEFGS